MAEIKISDVDKKMVADKVNSNILTYFNPIDDNRFSIEGLAFFNEHKQFFRLPLDQKENVTEAVWWLSSQPSGGQIRFKTNAKKISVKIKIHQKPKNYRGNKNSSSSFCKIILYLFPYINYNTACTWCLIFRKLNQK